MLWEDFEFKPGPIVSRDAAEALNRLWLEVRRLGQISVTAGLSLDSNEGGVVLSVAPETLNLPPGASNCCPCPVYQFTMSGLSPGCGGNGTYSLPFNGTPDQCVWSGNGADGSSATLVMIGGSGALSISAAGGCQAIYTLASGSCGEFNASLAFASSPSGWPFSLVISCGFSTPPGEDCCSCQVYQVVVSGSPGIGGGTYFLTFQTPCVWTQTLFDGAVGLVLKPGAAGSSATLTLATNGGIATFTGTVGDCNSFVLGGGASQTATVTCATPGTPAPPGGGGGFQPPGGCWTCRPYNLPPTTDVRCEAVSPSAGGIPGHSTITVYNRNVRIGWVNCCPVILSIGPWFFSHTAGCCDCNDVPGALCCQCSEYNLTISGVSAGCDANDTYSLFFTGPGCVWQGQGATFGGLAVLTMSDAVGGTAQLVITTGSCQATYTGAVTSCNTFTLSLLGTPVGTGWPATVTLTCAPVVNPGPSGSGSSGPFPCVPATCQFCDGTECNGVPNAPFEWTVKIPVGKPFGGVCGILLGTNWTLSYFESCTWEQSQIIGAFGVVMTLRIKAPKDSTLTILIFDLANNTTIASVVYHSAQPVGGNCCTTFDFALTNDADCDCPPIPGGGGGGTGGCQNCPDPPGTPTSVFFDGEAAGPFTGQFAPLNQKFTMVPAGTPCTLASPVQFDPVSGGYAQAFMTFGAETFDVEPPGEPQGSDYALFLAVTSSSGGVICWVQYYSPEGGSAGQPDDCCHIPTLDFESQGSPACTGTFPNAVIPIANCGGGDGGGGNANCALALSAIPVCCCTGGSSGVATQCCPNTDIPRTLHATLSATTGNCGCLPATFTLLWNSAHVQWEVDPTSFPPGFPPATGPCSGAQFNAVFRCNTVMPGTCFDMQLFITSYGINGVAPFSCDCASQTWRFTNVTFAGACNGTATINLAP